MNGDTTVTAAFSLRTYSIAATAGPNGSISPQGNVTVNYGASQSFTVAPNVHYRVADLKVDGLSQGALATYTFTHVISDHTIEVSFTPITYTLTLKTEGTGTGTVTTSPSGTLINAGTVVTLTAAPDVSSTFTGWSGGVSGTSPTVSLTMDGDTTVTAAFTLRTFTITATAGPNGSISPQESVTVNYGASQNFSIMPNACYEVASVMIDGAAVGSVTSYTFNNVTADHSIQASFLLVHPEAATLVSPTGKIADATPTYTWNAVPGATKYYLFVNDSTGSKIRTSYTATQSGCASGTGTCSITPDTVLTLGTVKWWIQTWNSAGYGPWSASTYFTLSRR
jgi:hypothetical protein